MALAVGLGVWKPLKAKADNDNKAPAYKVDPFWPKALPDRWVTGEVAGTCLDSNDHLFTVNRGPQNNNLTAKETLVAKASPPVIEFDRQGNVVNAWGDLAILPNGLHGCFVDYQDNVWIGGNGDGIVQKYSHSGNLLLQIGINKHPGYAKIPHIMDLAKSEDDRKLMELVFVGPAVGRPFFGPPGVPADRARALQEAFVRTMNDPGFKADADRQKIELTPLLADDMRRIVTQVYDTPKPLLEKAIQISAAGQK